MQLTLQYKFYVLYNYIIKIGYNSITNRNLQKRAKKARYESEKAFMETLRGVGCTVGEYAGDGRGEITDIAAKVMNPPVAVPSPTFSSLVRTGKTISATGK